MRLLHALLILSFAWLAGPALADQTDPRLDKLFQDLKAASAPAEAAPIEQQIWTIWLETSDEQVAALIQSGTQAMARGDYEAALKHFDEIVSLAPGFAEGWNKRATVHYLMDNLEASLQDIVKTLELEPRHFGALSGRGLVYIQRDDLQNALDAFQDALAVHPQMRGPRINAETIRKILHLRDI